MYHKTVVTIKIIREPKNYFVRILGTIIAPPVAIIPRPMSLILTISPTTIIPQILQLAHDAFAIKLL